MTGFGRDFYGAYHYHGNGSFPYFFLSPLGIQVERNQKVFKKRNLVFLWQQFNYRKWNLVLHVVGCRSKFADRRRRLRTLTKCSIAQRKVTVEVSVRIPMRSRPRSIDSRGLFSFAFAGQTSTGSNRCPQPWTALFKPHAP